MSDTEQVATSDPLDGGARGAVERAMASVTRDQEQPAPARPEPTQDAKPDDEQPKKDKVEPKPDPRHDFHIEQRAATRNTLEKHFSEYEHNIGGEHSLMQPQVLEAVESLRETFGQDLKPWIADLGKVEALLVAKDPRGLQELNALFAKIGPRFNLAKVKTPPSGKLDWEGAQAKLKARDDLTELAHEHGESIGARLVQLTGIVKMLSGENRMEGLARLAETYGFDLMGLEQQPEQPQDDDEAHRQTPEYQAARAEVNVMIEEVKQSGSLPGLGEPEVDAALLAVVKHPDFEKYRTDDPRTNLHRAHQLLRQIVQTSSQLHQRFSQEAQTSQPRAASAQRAADLKRKASLSVTGSPPAFVTSSRPAPSGAREALNRAFGA